MLFFQMLMNVKWMKGAVRGSVATPLAATIASVLRAVRWGQMARLVKVRWTTTVSVAGVWKEIQFVENSLHSWGFLDC